MNLNKLAKDITEAEGLKVSLSIAQVKEVSRILLSKMAKMSVWEIGEILKKYAKK